MTVNYNSSFVTQNLVLMLDAKNTKSWSPNIFGYAKDIGSWATVSGATNATISRDTTVTDSPAGGVPMKMVVTANDPYTNTYNSSTWNLCPAASGQTWTVSVWVKASAAGQNVEGPVIFGATSAGSYLEVYSAGTISVGTSWTRISYTATLTNASTAFLQLRLDGPNSGGTGINFWWDGLQIERGSSATAFSSAQNINGTSWYDLSGNRNTCNFNNVPLWNSSGYLTFNGSSNYGTITYASSLNFSGGQTVLILMNHTNTTGRPNPWNQAYGGSGTWTHEGGSNFNYYYGNAGSNTTPYTSLGSGSTATGTWYGMTSVRNTANIYWYQNDTQQATATNAYGVLLSDVNNITIGLGYTGNYWAGNIALILAYNRSLSADEIKQNFYAYRGRFNL